MTVLFAYDGSAGADAAITAAGGLLDRTDATAVVLTVWEPLLVEALRTAAFSARLPIPLDSASVDEHTEQLAHAAAQHGAQVARDAGFDARPVAVADDRNITDTIVATADEVDAEVIVIGARGLAGVRALLGSISTHVAQHAHRPVLVVPPVDVKPGSTPTDTTAATQSA